MPLDILLIGPFQDCPTCELCAVITDYGLRQATLSVREHDPWRTLRSAKTKLSVRVHQTLAFEDVVAATTSKFM